MKDEGWQAADIIFLLQNSNFGVNFLGGMGGWKVKLSRPAGGFGGVSRATRAGVVFIFINTPDGSWAVKTSNGVAAEGFFDFSDQLRARFGAARRGFLGRRASRAYFLMRQKLNSNE